MASEYEQIRLRNIEDNKRILAELGLVNPYKPLPRIIKRTNSHLKRKRDSVDSPASKRIKVAASATPESSEIWTPGTRRRSRRLLGKDAPETEDAEDCWKEEDDADDDEDFRPKISKDRPQVYGAIPGVEIGTHWMFRMEANRVGVHRPVIAGIHPGPNGAYSIALSGGYEDDLDYGECFTYTGEGGRDLKGTKANPKNLRTAPQSKHQSLSRGNKALVDSVESGLPVRVLRGYKLDSPFAPVDGYRYDGLYKVDKWWYTGGMSGFSVYKFALSRLKDQPPPPWYMNTETGDVTMSNESPLDISRSKEDQEKKDRKAARTERVTSADLLSEKMDVDENNKSPAEVGCESKDPLKPELGSVSEDSLTGGKQEDDSLKDLEKNGKSNENRNPDETSNKNESCESNVSKNPSDMSKSPSESIMTNENDTRSGKLNTNDEDLENTAERNTNVGTGSTDSGYETSSGSICAQNSKKSGIESNGSLENSHIVSRRDKVLDETPPEAATCDLHQKSSQQLAKDLLGNSVDGQNTELFQADDTSSQDSGIGVAQPNAANAAAVDSGGVISIIPGKFEVEDENRNITTCGGEEI